MKFYMWGLSLRQEVIDSNISLIDKTYSFFTLSISIETTWFWFLNLLQHFKHNNVEWQRSTPLMIKESAMS